MGLLKDPPSRIFQDDFSPAKGNALQACVASLLGLPLHDVPNFIALDCGYEEGINMYLQEMSPEHCTMTMVKKKVASVNESDLQKLCILRGKSPRGNFGHVVVARLVETNGPLFEMIHDPHPASNFLDKEETYGWCMFFQEDNS